MKEKPGKINIWQKYTIQWTFATEIYGSFPASREILTPYVQKKIKDGAITPTDIKLTETGRIDVRRETMSIEEIQELKLKEALETLPEEEQEQTEIEKRTLVFRRIEGHFAVHGGTIRSHLKECARLLASLVLPKRVEGLRSLNVRATNGLYIAEDWIPLLRDGQPIREPELQREFFVRATNPRTGAPLSSIKLCEGLRPNITLSFTLLNLGNTVSEQELDAIMSYGGIHGYGQERSRGYGRYLFEVAQQGDAIVLPVTEQKPTLEKLPKKSATTAKTAA
jgi:hypothetical protein